MSYDELVKVLRHCSANPQQLCINCPSFDRVKSATCSCATENMVKAADAIERLAAYEDTGLEPEEIQRVIATNQTHAKNHREMFEELAKYKQAEAEGRLIVLPCKVGGDLWVKDRDGKLRRMILDVPDIRCHCAKEDNLCAAFCDSPQAGVCAYRLKNDGSSIGETVFLTREEAEKALKVE